MIDPVPQDQQPLQPGEARVVDLTGATPRKDLPFYKAFALTYKDKQGKVWEGSFVIKRLSLADMTRMGMRAAQLDGGMTNIPDTIQMINRMVAHCEASFVEKPSWFDPEKMYDQELLAAIYSEVANFEGTFR